MKINGGVRFIENGITTSLRAMHVQSELIAMTNENVSGFDKVGYQRKESVVSSFSEYIGVHGLSAVTDDKPGRILISENPLDFAIANRGYFQIQGEDGVKLTRDGRFKIDKDGNLLNNEDEKVLSDSGMPIKLHVVPEKLEDIKVTTKGQIKVFNKDTNRLEDVAKIGVVDSNGALVLRPDIKQGFTECSNVSLEREFLGMAPVIRNFEANRQMFMIESQNLTKAIQQLGSSS